jgi:putative DNA primase/helicase
VTIQILPLTDWGNGERFAEQNQCGVRFVHQWDRWYCWDGLRWAEDQQREVLRRAASTARNIAIEGPHAGSEEERRAIYRHAVRSEGADALERMLRCASANPRLSVHPDQLDCDPWALMTANGKVNLRTGALDRPSRDELGTRLCPVPFRGLGEAAPTFDRFLTRVLPTEELRAFVRRAVGYSLTGDVGEHALFLLYGNGANGKSTLLEVLLAILGDYAKSASPGLLMAGRDGRHEEELAELKGVRFATCVESGLDQAFNEPRLKYVTGGDTISARFLYGKRFEFKPTHKLWVATNHKPRVRGGDEGIWRRLRLIPFDQVIPDHERDPRLKEKLLTEAPGILAWAVRGCLEWQRDGLGTSEEVRDATADYRDGEDRIGPFLEEVCVQSPAARVVASRLFEA